MFPATCWSPTTPRISSPFKGPSARLPKFEEDAWKRGLFIRISSRSYCHLYLGEVDSWRELKEILQLLTPLETSNVHQHCAGGIRHICHMPGWWIMYFWRQKIHHQPSSLKSTSEVPDQPGVNRPKHQLVRLCCFPYLGGKRLLQTFSFSSNLLHILQEPDQFGCWEVGGQWQATPVGRVESVDIWALY